MYICIHSYIYIYICIIYKNTHVKKWTIIYYFFCIKTIIILDFKIKLATERANRIYDDNVYINIYLKKKSTTKITIFITIII